MCDTTPMVESRDLSKVPLLHVETILLTLSLSFVITITTAAVTLVDIPLSLSSSHMLWITPPRAPTGSKRRRQQAWSDDGRRCLPRRGRR